MTIQYMSSVHFHMRICACNSLNPKPYTPKCLACEMAYDVRRDHTWVTWHGLWAFLSFVISLMMYTCGTRLMIFRCVLPLMVLMYICRNTYGTRLMNCRCVGTHEVQGWWSVDVSYLWWFWCTYVMFFMYICDVFDAHMSYKFDVLDDDLFSSFPWYLCEYVT